MDDPTTQSDADLLAHCSRDPQLFGVFYQRHHATILRYLLRRTHCPQSAADLTAETFATAFVKRTSFQPMGKPAEAWLIGIARNQLGSFARKERVSRKYRRKLGMQSVVLSPDEFERVEDMADLGSMREKLADAMSTLPENQSEAIRLRVVDELPYSAVASRLGIAEGAARVRVSRGLTRLADLLESA